MTKFSVHIESPNHIDKLKPFNIETIIIDMNFCSIRSHNQHLWKPNELNIVKTTCNPKFFTLNLDGLYSDQELNIILSNIHHLKLDAVFNAFRIQDPGLILWIKQHFPNKVIQVNTETAGQNIEYLKTLSTLGASTTTLNHEIPYKQIIEISKKNTNIEIFVQGPILIQYSRRKFLSDWYQSSPEKPIKLNAEDSEFKNRTFTFLNTNFGHLMFAHFHRSLATETKKLKKLTNYPWLIDGRGEPFEYLIESLSLYSSLNNSIVPIENTLTTLEKLSKKPQKPGFFISNNTDYDWRNNNIDSKKNRIGKVISCRKFDSIFIELNQNLNQNSIIFCQNPDNSNIPFKIKFNTKQDKKFCWKTQKNSLTLESTIELKSFNYYCLPWTKGIQTNAQLYIENP